MQHLNNTDTHNLHTERTQYAHNMHTHKHTYMQHTEQRTENNQDTENTCTTSTQNNTLVRTVIHIHSFDFIVEDYISKNSIIQLYTKLIHFGHLIYEVSK